MNAPLSERDRIATTRDPRRAGFAADLHDRELCRDTLVALWARCYDGLLWLAPQIARR